MREEARDRTVPVLVTLLALAFVLMTADTRSGGTGATGALRTGTNAILDPLQRGAAAVASPFVAAADALGDLAGLRAENEALRAELAAAEAKLAAVDGQLQRLATLERVNRLELDVDARVTTKANVVGRVGGGDLSFKIDRGEESGVLAGHPVLDENGYVVGRVARAWEGGAVVVPIIADVSSVTVNVGSQQGTLSPVLGEDTMVLDVFETAAPVSAGDRVVTSPLSVAYPPSLPIGEIIEDAEPQGQALAARVRPYADPTSLTVVVVVAWPTDASAAEEPAGEGAPGG